jgi:DNA-binding transcriptional MerR regulator
MVRQSGNTPRTIRFYEEVGLIRPRGRTQGGHRLYEPRELEKLQLITDLRLAGFSLEEIRVVFGLKRATADAKRASQQMMQLLNDKLEDLKRRLAALIQLKEEFAGTMSVLQNACAECKQPPGQELCSSCAEVDHGNLPRTLRWVWHLD